MKVLDEGLNGPLHITEFLSILRAGDITNISEAPCTPTPCFSRSLAKPPGQKAAGRHTAPTHSRAQNLAPLPHPLLGLQATAATGWGRLPSPHPPAAGRAGPSMHPGILFPGGLHLHHPVWASEEGSHLTHRVWGAGQGQGEGQKSVGGHRPSG